MEWLCLGLSNTATITTKDGKGMEREKGEGGGGSKGEKEGVEKGRGIEGCVYHIGFSVMLKVPIVPPVAGHTLHQS